MNELNQTIEMAKWCGWTEVTWVGAHHGSDDAIKGFHPHVKGFYFDVPRFLYELNSLVQAEDRLKAVNKHNEYLNRLIDIVWRDNGSPKRSKRGKTRDAITATAPQRVEAVLKTIGTWRES